MGYYTRFEGGVEGHRELLAEFEADANNNKLFGQHNLPLSDWLYGEFFGGEPSKWYSWEEDLAGLSKKYPNLLFWLTGEGEESGDIWKAWGRNGKTVTVRARIVFDKPDLDVELPSPDMEKAIAKAKAKKQAEIDAKVAALESEIKKLREEA